MSSCRYPLDVLKRLSWKTGVGLRTLLGAAGSLRLKASNFEDPSPPCECPDTFSPDDAPSTLAHGKPKKTSRKSIETRMNVTEDAKDNGARCTGKEGKTSEECP